MLIQDLLGTPNDLADRFVATAETVTLSRPLCHIRYAEDIFDVEIAPLSPGSIFFSPAPII